MQMGVPDGLRLPRRAAGPAALRRAEPARRPGPDALTGDVAPTSRRRCRSTMRPAAAAQAAFLATAQSPVDTLLWLLYVSLAVVNLVVLLLAARMIAMRRSAELAMRQARGASVRQIAAVVGGGAAVACVPAAALAVLAAVLLVPGRDRG